MLWFGRKFFLKPSVKGPFSSSCALPSQNTHNCSFILGLCTCYELWTGMLPFPLHALDLPPGPAPQHVTYAVTQGLTYLVVCSTVALLRFLITFEQGAPLFILSPVNSVTGPASTSSSWPTKVIPSEAFPAPLPLKYSPHAPSFLIHHFWCVVFTILNHPLRRCL